MISDPQELQHHQKQLQMQQKQQDSSCFISFFEESGEFSSLLVSLVDHTERILLTTLPSITDSRLANDPSVFQSTCHSFTSPITPWVVRIDAILSKYQEQPNLLDPHLEVMVSPVVNCLRKVMDHIDEELSPSANSIHIPDSKRRELQAICLNYLYHVLYILCKVRGYKTVGRLLTSIFVLCIPNTTFICLYLCKMKSMVFQSNSSLMKQQI